MNKKEYVPKAHKTAKDSHGNPAGTTYNEQGIASHEEYEEGLINRPNEIRKDSEGKEIGNAFMYNEDGSIFVADPEAKKKNMAFKEKISSLNKAIADGKQNIEFIQKTMSMIPADAHAPLLSAINSHEIAIKSNEGAKAAVENEMEDFRISQVTPAQRADEKELVFIMGEITRLKTREAELKVRMKISGIETAKEDVVKNSTVKASSEDQKARLAADVSKYGTQGKAILSKIKEGLRDFEITNYYGLGAGIVSPVKMKWLKTEEGGLYEIDKNTSAVVLRK